MTSARTTRDGVHRRRPARRGAELHGWTDKTDDIRFTYYSIMPAGDRKSPVSRRERETGGEDRTGEGKLVAPQ
jgi:hypothetical protein